jgi:drug/metabolite transporter (DMT)-like permease
MELTVGADTRDAAPARPQMPRSLSDLAVDAAPVLFVVLWSSGFIGAKFGLPFADPMTLLFIRMLAAVLLLFVLVIVTRAPWLSRTNALHSLLAGLLMHGCYLGGVFVALVHHLPTGFAALFVSLQPILTSTLANRLRGERVRGHQWSGCSSGLPACTWWWPAR